MSHDSIILFFVKAPFAGRVKSRLAAAVGDDHARALYMNFILDLLDMLAKTGLPFRICFYPPASAQAVSELLGLRHEYMPQEGHDLGERMQHAFRRVFSEGFTRALLIGSDIPDLPEAVIQDAMDALARFNAVLGPAADGGYYLIGFHNGSFSADVFHGISWSADTVLSDTAGILKRSSLTTYYTRAWSDVDTCDDLKRLFERNRKTPFNISRTMTYLKKHKKRLFLPERTQGPV